MTTGLFPVLSALARQPVAVLKRELLWNGGVVQIKVPAVCREGGFEDIKFIQFARFVKGGMVNFFVHDDSPTQYCGKIVTASMQVFRKEHADGRTFLYVDLRPIAKSATHRLVVEPGLVYTLRDAVVYHTPAPLQGSIIITKIKPS
ncbi:hypothetical protein A3D70_00855 [Candidatus Adlerbacteria bacterium RIFCSPHIGHO2_02_FULL_54_18]|uniref:Uncharacterized protein n=2 Tax=Candidatus Adleribacteriota TaxID=1752736 RepID=A0A1F4Y256_9BACT|nr:MAG: hypothetical protein A2949_01450 [Candidatus Adlerbacteria bacterium RIFCSPLOWO2_01_FULL_54_21b]OGC87928.1 MAG: hypothetical protein A3D70_00855 [Candidatus Adlerbacteria bacterium RIFCSPHIGHO2_02_FULL_54_18]